ncbi:MAG: hypothetical protein JXJ04_00890 [Spirochaetales bacterium]|nr:hypothetical protein [Spirochaetales bacterium]
MRMYFILCLCSIFLFTGCEKNRGKEDFLKALLSLDNSTYAHQEIDPGIKKEIGKIVETFENAFEKEVTANEELVLYYKRLGAKYLELAEIYKAIDRRLTVETPEFASSREESIYNKMLAIRYYDDEMFGKAYKSFNRAIELDPGNPLLYYNASVCAGWMAKSLIDPDSGEQREKWYTTAESGYKRAIELDPYYIDALYGYSVLLILELNRAGEAIPLLKKILEKEQKNIKSLFLLARGYYQIGDYEQSLDHYDLIIKLSTSDDIRSQAELLKMQVKEMLYDTQ